MIVLLVGAVCVGIGVALIVRPVGSSSEAAGDGFVYLSLQIIGWSLITLGVTIMVAYAAYRAVKKRAARRSGGNSGLDATLPRATARKTRGVDD